MKKTVIILGIFLLSYATTRPAHARVLFEDDFNSGDIGKWTIRRNTCSPTNWKYQNDKYGMVILSKSCLSEAAPHDSFWDENWNDYVIEVDMDFVSGVDRNIAWRYSNPTNWVDIHFQGTKAIFQRATLVDSDNVQKFYNGNTYHFRIEAIGNKHKVYYYDTDTPENVSYLEAESNKDVFLYGRPALQVSSGAVNYSEVWFDNLVVYSIDNRLKVPHFSQRDPAWGGIDYDHATTSAEIADDIDIEDWGCAMTSAAMVLNYHGIDKSPTGENTNPEVLNEYLINNHGYNKKGRVNWSAITNYVEEATKSGFLEPDTAVLEFNYPSYNEGILEQDIENQLPSIVKIVMNDQGTPWWNDDDLHFVVARGYEDGKIDINDPLDLEDTEATMAGKYSHKVLRQMGRFKPSHTDLSYIWLYQYNPLVESLVENEASSSGWLAGEVTEEIPGSMVYEEGRIANANGSFNDQEGYQVVSVAKPESGKYLVRFTTEEATPVDAELFLFDQGADPTYFAIEKELEAGESVEYELVFDKDTGEWTWEEVVEPDEGGCDHCWKPVKHLWNWWHKWWNPWVRKWYQWSDKHKGSGYKSGFWYILNK